MWFFLVMFQLLILVFVGGLVVAALRHVDAFFTAVIDLIRHTTAATAIDSTPDESPEDPTELQ